jgi:SMC interacting uncharacterized protein involved in chromosome segregation
MTLTARERRCLVLGYRIAKVEAERKREAMASGFFATLAEIHEELSDVRNEITRLHQIDQAIATEREPWRRLH